VRKLTAEEREAKIKEMQDMAQGLDESRNMKLFGTKDVPRSDKYNKSGVTEKEEEKKDAKFLRDVGKAAYLESDMKLEERINRTQHYRGRDIKGGDE
jgi:hypothetical protein